MARFIGGRKRRDISPLEEFCEVLDEAVNLCWDG